MSSHRGLWMKLAKLLLLAIMSVVFLRAYVIGIYKVPTMAMLPSLYRGDIIIAWKWPFNPVGRILYKFWYGEEYRLARGDVIVFRHPEGGSRYVKRIIALPGEVLAFASRSRWTLGGKLPAYQERLDLPVGIERDHFQAFYELYDEAVWPVLGRKTPDDRRIPDNLVIPLAHYYVLGDHRDISDDSRDWGAIPQQNIVAIAKWVLASVEWQVDAGEGFRWHRFLQTIP